MSKFLSGLSSSSRPYEQDQILGGDNIPTLTVNFSRVMRVTTGADVSPAPSVEQFTMVSRRGRGRSRGRDFTTHLEEDVDPTVAGIVALIRAPDNVNITRGIIISLASVERSLVTLNGHNWLILTLLPLVVLLMFLHPLPLVLLALPLWCYHRTSMTYCVNSSSLRPVIQ